MKIILASENIGKALEFSAVLGQEIESLASFDIKLPPEIGETYEENAIAKAKFVAEATNQIALADDSGLEVIALNNKPGIYSARFGGFSEVNDRNNYLLELLKDVDAPRTAKFVCVLALAWPNGSVQTFRGEVYGEILKEPRGTNGFGYDPLFFYPALGKTFAELSKSEKDSVSHRGQAIKKFLENMQLIHEKENILRKQ